jgi:hypothetical protein
MYLWKTRMIRPFSVLVFVLALIAGAAQGEAGPRDHPGARGPSPLASLLLRTEVHTALALTTAQEAQWSALQAAAQALRTQSETSRANLQALIAAELADATPDLVAIESAVRGEHQTIATASAAISAQAVALYATLNTGQQAIVASAAQAQYQHVRSRP